MEDDTVAKLEKKEFKVIHTPIDDFSIPKDKTLFIRDVKRIVNLLRNGKNIYIHCLAGHGRTGMAILTIKIILGEDPRTATKEVKLQVKGPEMREQITFALLTGREVLNQPSSQ